MAGGHNYLCCRKMGNSLEKSVYNELEKAIDKLKVRGLFTLIRGLITCINGYQIIFSGLDDVEKVKSITPKKGVITDIWIEEATEVARDDVKQLRKRLRGLAIYDGKRIRKRIILSFNPIYKSHWIVKEFFTPNGWKDDQTYFEGDKIRILKTTHLENNFLDPEDHEELENETDPYWKEVYSLGNWGSLGDSIFTNWKVANLSSLIPTFDNIRNGLDFGYSQDPNSFVRLDIDKKRMKIHIFVGWETRGMTNPQIAAKLKETIGHEPIFCDSAEPKSIEELRTDGIDARPVKKGKDSILHGIKWLQKFEIIIDESLQHIINEMTIWGWKKDKDGNSLPIPEDKNNHSIDATRYATEIDHTGFFDELEW